MLMPEFYYSPPLSKQNQHLSDRDWIAGKLARLGTKDREIACRQYREIYLGALRCKQNARKIANNWLKKIVDEKGVTKAEYTRAVELSLTESGDPDLDRLQEILDRVKNTQKQSRKTILGMN
ncbi:TPA: hypothetical protein ACX6NV_000584 [Photobacterium damselae]